MPEQALPRWPVAFQHASARGANGGAARLAAVIHASASPLQPPNIAKWMCLDPWKRRDRDSKGSALSRWSLTAPRAREPDCDCLLPPILRHFRPSDPRRDERNVPVAAHLAMPPPALLLRLTNPICAPHDGRDANITSQLTSYHLMSPQGVDRTARGSLPQPCPPRSPTVSNVMASSADVRLFEPDGPGGRALQAHIQTQLQSDDYLGADFLDPALSVYLTALLSKDPGDDPETAAATKKELWSNVVEFFGDEGLSTSLSEWLWAQVHDVSSPVAAALADDRRRLSHEAQQRAARARARATRDDARRGGRDDGRGDDRDDEMGGRDRSRSRSRSPTWRPQGRAAPAGLRLFTSSVMDALKGALAAKGEIQRRAGARAGGAAAVVGRRPPTVARGSVGLAPGGGGATTSRPPVSERLGGRLEEAGPGAGPPIVLDRRRSVHSGKGRGGDLNGRDDSPPPNDGGRNGRGSSPLQGGRGVGRDDRGGGIAVGPRGHFLPASTSNYGPRFGGGGGLVPGQPPPPPRRGDGRGGPPTSAAEAEIERLRAENARLRATQPPDRMHAPLDMRRGGVPMMGPPGMMAGPMMGGRGPAMMGGRIGPGPGMMGDRDQMDRMRPGMGLSGRGPGRPGGPPPLASSSAEVAARSVVVKNVDFKATEDALAAHFSVCGRVVGVAIRRHKPSGRPLGSAFVEFAHPSSVAHAVSLTGSVLLDREVSVVKREAEAPASNPRPECAAGPSGEVGGAAAETGGVEGAAGLLAGGTAREDAITAELAGGAIADGGGRGGGGVGDGAGATCSDKHQTTRNNSLVPFWTPPLNSGRRVGSISTHF